MLRPCLCASSFVALATLAAAQTQPTLAPEAREFVSVDAPIVALTDVLLIDGTGAPPRAGQTVLLRNGRISEIGPAGEVDVPATAEVLELPGRTVIPGLIGLHNHTFYTSPGAIYSHMVFSAPRLYLGSGVTTIRTTGTLMAYSDLNVRAQIDRGDIAGPRIHATGPYLDNSDSPLDTIEPKTATPEDARRLVAYWAEEGVEWLKAYTSISRETLGAAIDEAHKHGIKVTAHLCSVTHGEAVELGIDNLEHSFITMSDFVANKEVDQCPPEMTATLANLDIDSDEVQESIRHIVAHGVSLTSTLSVFEWRIPHRPDIHPRALEMMTPRLRQEYAELRRRTRETAAERAFMTGLLTNAMAFNRAFVAAGGVLASGVDPAGGALPGFGDHRNYELFIESGFRPEEAIQIMTANGAKVLGVDSELGTVAVGKLADLVVIDGDLTSGGSMIRNVSTVFKDGIGYDAVGLLDSVKGQVGLR
ncbi:MAG TPA: amidohydrolase family protein [Acidobacteriota bacterium]|nr:amidohydrolase family protein [Acidobacteriota bacterium]